MAENWYQRGVKAGKTEDWMNLEETLAEDRERHPRLTSEPAELVQVGIDGWEETDHFSILYGQPMLDDARDAVGVDGMNDDVIERYQENKDEFWNGYIAGRKEVGKDVLAVARRLTRKRAPATARRKTKSRRRSSDAPSGIQRMR